MRELSPLFGTGTLELGTHYHFTPTSHTRDIVRRVGPFLPLLRAGHTCWLTELQLWTLWWEHSLKRTEVRIKHYICICPSYKSVRKALRKLSSTLFLVSQSKKGLQRNKDLLQIKNFLTSWAFYLIFCLMVLPLQSGFSYPR